MTTLSDEQTSGASEGAKSNRKIRNRAGARRGASLGLRVVDGGADASAPESATRVAWRRVTTLGSHAGAAARRVGRELAHSDPYTGQPASIRDVVDYTRKGGWVPGEHGQALESWGYLYGVVVAIPLTVILNSLCWVMQRFTRVAAIVLIAGLLWLSGINVWDGLTSTWRWLPAWAYVGLVVVSCLLVFPLPKRAT